MESLKAFTIGTSGAVFLSHLYLLKLADKEYYDYPLRVYVLLLPIYYGLMNVLGSTPLIFVIPDDTIGTISMFASLSIFKIPCSNFSRSPF